MSGTAVQTNGVGRRTIKHLNLTVSLAKLDRPGPLPWGVPAYPNRFAAKRRTFKD